MNLWIRSQDKTKLLKAKDLYTNIPLDFGSGGFGIYVQSEQTKTGFERIGIYKTKERALEVLDEIQSVIATHIGRKANDRGLDYFGCAIYQMPQE